MIMANCLINSIGKTAYSDGFGLPTGDDINMYSQEALQNNRPILAEALISSAVIDAAHESLASKNLWVKVEL